LCHSLISLDFYSTGLGQQSVPLTKYMFYDTALQGISGSSYF
jgi:hypothetical protein